MNESMTPAFLETSRLRLRPIQEADGDAFHEMYADPETMKYWSNPPVQSRQESQTLVNSDIEAMEQGNGIFWSVVLEQSVIGKCVLFQFSLQNRRAEVGYLLRRDYWRRGLMTEAMGEILRHAYEDLKLHRLEADVDKDNQGSIQLLESLGFQKEGYFRERWNVYGQWQDSIMYGMLKPDWKAARSG